MTAIEYTIYEQPQPPQLDSPILENPTSAKPSLDFPTTAKPTTENPTQLNKDISRTDLPKEFSMAFFNSAVGVLQTLVIALGAGLGIWGVINLLEGYGNDNPGANAHVR